MRRIIVFFLCVCMALPAVAQQQSREELEKRKKEILEAIRQTEDELATTKKNKNATIGQLRALQNKLAERQRLISTINEQVGQISTDIQSSAQEVEALRQRLELLRVRYAQSVRYAYETRSSYDMLAFIFSSNDFNDALRRMKYLKKFRDSRKQQAEQIRITQAQIQKKIGVLNTQKSEKDNLLTSQLQQKQQLVQETNETNQVVRDLKGREKELTAEITRNKKNMEKVKKAIDEVIRREIEIARKKAEEEEKKRKEEEARKATAATTAPGTYNNPNNKSKTTVTYIPVPNTATKTPRTTTRPKTSSASSSTAMLLTPEALALSNNFESNRGKLPWPVEKGFISDNFGTHPHPVAEKVMIDNNGIDIRTSPNATARAVFDGTVSKCFYVPGVGWTAIIIHGRYFTVYSGLSSMSVKEHQQVHTKQPIGVVGNNDEGEPTINFQIWKDVGKKAAVKMDPTGWIAR